MVQSSQQIWRHRVASLPFYPVTAISDVGLMLGASTVLARLGEAMPSGVGHYDAILERDEDHDRLMALLAVATRGRVPNGIVPHLRVAAKHWCHGDKALAHIRLAYARIPALDSEEDAYRLSLADTLLQAGFAPAQLMRELGFQTTQMRVLKFPGQLHVPKGNGRESGRFGTGRQGSVTPQPAFLEMPIPLELPVEPMAPFGTTPGTPTFPIPPVTPIPTPGTVPDAGAPRPDGRPTQTADTEDDDPRQCPKPVADTPHGETAAARQYAIDGHNEVNKINPLKDGEAIFYHGRYFDDCARTDDPQGRWKAGYLFEFKGPTHEMLFDSPFAWWSSAYKLMNQAEQQNRAVEGTGRRDVYLVAEFAAAEQIRAFFDKRFLNIDVFHFAPVTPVPAARNRKSWVLDEEQSIWI